MTNELLTEIQGFVDRHPSLTPFPPATAELINEAEQRLGFAIPVILKSYYLRIGNGYAGASCDLMGLMGGCQSDLGNILDVYPILKEGQESERREWKTGLLPFCAWGCNIFSCVDSTDSRHLISTFEDFRLWPQSYSLQQFFEWWAAGIEILRQENVETSWTNVTNPFTGKKVAVPQRHRGKKDE